MGYSYSLWLRRSQSDLHIVDKSDKSPCVSFHCRSRENELLKIVSEALLVSEWEFEPDSGFSNRLS